MSNLLPRSRVRLFCDADNYDYVKDAITNQAPAIWRGADAQFEIGVGLNGAVVGSGNLAAIASITVEVRPCTVSGGAITPPLPSVTPVFSGTTSTIDDAVTQALWNAGIVFSTTAGSQNAIIAFTNSQTNLTAGTYWITVFATTSDSPARNIPIAAGKFVINEPGCGTAPATPASALATPCFVLQFPGVTQIASNTTSGLGDVNVAPFKGLPAYKVDCPDYATGLSPVVTQFWQVQNTTAADSNGFIQSGPDYDASTNPYKWVRTL